MPKQIFVFTCFLFAFYSGACQSHEMEDTIHKKAIHFASSNQDSVLFFAKILQESRNFGRALTGHYYEANVYYRQWEYTKCEAKLRYILRQIENTDSPSSGFQYSALMVGKTIEEVLNNIKLNVYRRFFYLRVNQNRYTEAFDYLNLREECIEKSKLKNSNYYRNIISLQLSRADLHIRLGNHQTSLLILQRIKKEIDVVEIDPNDPFINHFYLEKAHILNELIANFEYLTPENPTYADSVKVYTELTYEATKVIENRDRENKRAHLIRIGLDHLNKNEYEKALDALNKTDTLYSNIEEPAITLTLKAACFVGLAKADSAIYYAHQFLKVGNSGHIHTADRISTYDILAKSYYMQDQLDSAYKYSNKATAQIKSESYDRGTTQERLTAQRIREINALNERINEKRSLFQYHLTIALIISGTILLVSLVQVNAKRKKEIRRLHKIPKVNKGQGPKNKPKLGAETKINTALSNRVLKELNEIEKSNQFLDSSFTMASLSKQLKTNTSYLSRIINENKGKTFSQYLVSLRINYLIDQLENKPEIRKHTIEALGALIGYSNASSFTRAFKNHLGQSPSKYLKRTYPEAFKKD